MTLARSLCSIRSNPWSFANVLSACIEEIRKALIVGKHLVGHHIGLVRPTVASLGPMCVQSGVVLG